MVASVFVDLLNFLYSSNVCFHFFLFHLLCWAVLEPVSLIDSLTRSTHRLFPLLYLGHFHVPSLKSITIFFLSCLAVVYILVLLSFCPLSLLLLNWCLFIFSLAL